MNNVQYNIYFASTHKCYLFRNGGSLEFKIFISKHNFGNGESMENMYRVCA